MPPTSNQQDAAGTYLLHHDRLPLPPIQNSQYSSLRYGILSVYRLLFSIIFAANLIAFIIITSRQRLISDTITASAANLLVVSISRQPLFINSIVLLAGSLPRSAPYRIRKYAAKIGHYGGLHSGSGIASIVWYISFVGILTRTHITEHTISSGVLTVSYLVLILLVSIAIIAYPAIRFKHHDVFELAHRYSSWASVALVWLLLILLAGELRGGGNQKLGTILVNMPAFWLLLILTVTLFIPWITLRRVPVRSEILSSHAIRLHFDYTGVSLGQGISIARHPLKDWHSFAAISNQDETGFSLVVSKAGDWTAGCIRDQPTFMWKRAIPIYGFSYCTRLFNRILIVATGSGIGPCLSILKSEDLKRFRLLWQTRNPKKTYGEDILGLVAQLDSTATIIDTDEQGRQDMLPIAWHLSREMNAEAVFVVSTPKVVQELVSGLEARGVAAYGPIFDS